MRLEQFRTQGIGAPFRDRAVSIDFAGLGPGVVAIIGGNGAGKSHLLELTGPGVLFRELPSYRGPTGKRGEALVDHVHPDTRDAFVEVSFALRDATYRLRVAIDGKRRKTEAYFWCGTGAEPIAGPLVSDVDATLAGLVPSRALFLAGPFACQGGHDGFFRLGPAERKALFVEMLGLGQLEALAAAAAAREKATLTELEQVRRERADVDERAARVAAIDAALATLDGALAADEASLAAAGERAAAARGALEDATAALSTAEATAEATRDAYARHVAERTRVVDRLAALTDRLAALDAQLADVPDAAAAATERVAVEGELAVAEQRAAETLAASAAIAEELAAIAAELATARATHAALKRAVAEAEAAMQAVAEAAVFAARAAEGAPLVEAARIALDDAENARPSLAAAAEAEIAADRVRAGLDAERRTTAAQAGLLGRVPGVPECEACPLTTSARTARDRLVEIDAALADLSAESSTARLALSAHDARLTHLRECLARGRDWQAHLERRATVPAAVRAQADRLGTATQDLIDLTTRGTARAADQDRLAAERATLDAEHGRHAASRDGLRARVATLTGLIDRAAAAASARGERQAVAVARDAAAVELATLDTVAPLAPPDLAALRDAVEQARVAADAATRAAATAATAVEDLRTRRARLDGERAGLGDVVTQAAAVRDREQAAITAAGDWAVLAQGLGRNGCQALLIDAAGPEVSAIANDLLATCYTPRFQIALTTTQPTADGKGVKEVFEPRLLDAEAGRDGTRGSGGETALIDAALRLAMTVVNTQRSGVPMETLWLDEATAALSAENAPRYVAMVRRAMAHGGFHQALVVTHDPNVWEACDARLIVEDGAVRVWAPVREAA